MKMNFEQAMDILNDYNDPVVRQAAKVIQQHDKNRRDTINKVIKALGELRAGVKYLIFDLQCTRQERDELKTKLEG